MKYVEMVLVLKVMGIFVWAVPECHKTNRPTKQTTCFKYFFSMYFSDRRLFPYGFVYSLLNESSIHVPQNQVKCDEWPLKTALSDTNTLRKIILHGHN